MSDLESTEPISYSILFQCSNKSVLKRTKLKSQLQRFSLTKIIWKIFKNRITFNKNRRKKCLTQVVDLFTAAYWSNKTWTNNVELRKQFKTITVYVILRVKNTSYKTIAIRTDVHCTKSSIPVMQRIKEIYLLYYLKSIFCSVDSGNQNSYSEFHSVFTNY